MDRKQISKFHLQNFIDLNQSNFEHSSIFKDKYLEKPWQVLYQISQYIKDYLLHRKISLNNIKQTNQRKDQQTKQQNNKQAKQQRLNSQQKPQSRTHSINKGKCLGNVYIDQYNVIIGSGTIIQHGAMIKAPTIIGSNCQIRKGAYIRGNVIIGNNCIIGNSCQIKNSIIMNQSQVPHFNYIGDSILGTKAHISAAAITSNFRLDGKTINILTNQQKIDTKMIKFGAIIGDKSQIGCNVVLNPGSLIGKNCWVYPNISFRGYLKSDTILKLKQNSEQIHKNTSKNKPNL